MSPITDTPLYLHHRFEDFDALAQAAQQWDLDLLQLDRGRFEGEVFQAFAGSVLLSEGRFGRNLEQRGASPPGARTFVVPATPDVHFQWRGKHVGSEDLLLFPRHGELHAVSGPDFHVFTISLPESLLCEIGEACGVSDLSRILCFEKVRISPSLAGRLRQRLSRLREAVKEDPALLWQRAVRTELDSEIPRLLIQAMDVPGWSRRERMPNRHRAVRRAKEFIVEHERRPISVRDLCWAANVSERTLQYAFLDCLGVTPKTYLKAVRLNGVRRDLRRVRPENSTVTRVAASWGFWHMGQFATDYRKHFGELPSQTLATRLE